MTSATFGRLSFHTFAGTLSLKLHRQIESGPPQRFSVPPFRLDQLDKKDTTILKGLAILAILFHNFFHVIPEVHVHENEFDFDSARFPEFLHAVVHPSLTIQALFSFFGHYGVQVFIFLSAYGLAKSHWNDGSSWTSFMWSRIKKFYPMFAAAVVLWAMLVTFSQGTSWFVHDAGPELLMMFAGLTSIIPGMGLPPIGPWWFMPFIMQFYAIWPILRKLTKRFGWHGLLVLAIIGLLVTQGTRAALMPYGIRLTETPLGRMRILCFGIFAAHYPIRITHKIAALAVLLVIFGNVYFPLFPLASISAAVFAVWAYTNLRNSLRNSRFLEVMGNYSLSMFLINGIVRAPFVRFASTSARQLLLAVISFVITVGFSVLLQEFAPSETPHKAPAREQARQSPAIRSGIESAV